MFGGGREVRVASIDPLGAANDDSTIGVSHTMLFA